MAGLSPGFGAAKALVRMRVILAGEGAIREERGVFRATLPGTRTIVEIDDRAATAQLVGTGGKASEAKLDLKSEILFSGFMHGVDTVIAGSGRIPIRLLELADEYARVCAEGNAALASIVNDGNMDLSDATASWSPGLAFRALAEAGRNSGDPHLVDAAERALSLANDEVEETRRFSALDLQLRWCDLVERWASAASASYPTEAGTWVEIKTRNGLHAAARKVGTTMADLLVGEGKARIPFEDAIAYALYDEAGDISAVGVAYQGILSVHRAPGADPVEDAADVLRAEVCGSSVGRTW